jgi:hypothetical protein
MHETPYPSVAPRIRPIKCKGYQPGALEIPKSEIYTADALKANIWAASVMQRFFCPINIHHPSRLKIKSSILAPKYIHRKQGDASVLELAEFYFPIYFRRAIRKGEMP